MAMDFFERQDVARQKTGRLVLLFVLGVLLMMIALHFVAGFALTMVQLKTQGGELTGQSPFLDPLVMVAVAGLTLTIVFLGSIYKVGQLRAGGSTVASSLGGRLIRGDTTDADERKLLNVVEEMAIASGIPVPMVFVLDEERGINAFAAGFSPEDAVVAVSRGCMMLLSRDELQGVVAHEFSHILNGDMRLNIRLMGVVHGIMVISLLGMLVFRTIAISGGGSRRRSSSDSGSGQAMLVIMVVGLGMIVVGYIGYLFGCLIKSAVSRQREYLADASAVQFTRNPDGIGGALQKIGGNALGGLLVNPKAPEASHMFFAEGIATGFQSMFATHPDLDDRIKRITPDWDGKFPKIKSVPPRQLGAQDSKLAGAGTRFERMQERQRASGAGDRLKDIPPSAMSAMGTFAAATMIQSIGQPTPAHVEHARQLIQQIPEDLQTAAHESFQARALVLCLLIDRNNEECRSKQLEAINDSGEYGLHETTMQLLPEVCKLDDMLRLPLLDMSLPALDSMSPSQFKSFHRSLMDLIHADDQVDLFEWSLQRILRRHLKSHHEKAHLPRVQYYGLQRLHGEVAVVLNVLANAGHDDPNGARAAFTSAATGVGASSSGFVQSNRFDFVALDSALSKLSECAPPLKQKMIHACAVCVVSDNEVKPIEAELLRSFADALGCPIPPILPGQPLQTN